MYATSCIPRIYFKLPASSTHIQFDVDDEGRVHNVKYSGGGCVANLKTIGMLVEGMRATEVIERLEGIMCKDKGSSCGDQLAQALKEYLA